MTQRLYGIKELIEKDISKSQLAKLIDLPNLVAAFDYALPQPWLDEQASPDFRQKFMGPEVSYIVILGTTFWCYPKDEQISEYFPRHGIPVSGCFEVARSLIGQVRNFGPLIRI